MLKKLDGGVIVVEDVDPRLKNKMASYFAPAASTAFLLPRNGLYSFKLKNSIIRLTIKVFVFKMIFWGHSGTEWSSLERTLQKHTTLFLWIVQ